MIRLLFIGDIVGKPGRELVRSIYRLAGTVNNPTASQSIPDALGTMWRCPQRTLPENRASAASRRTDGEWPFTPR